MSDYFDIIRSAAEKGVILDSCGEDERQYWWGLNNDLCGMSVEDAKAVQYWDGTIPEGGGGEDEKKKTNTVDFVMQRGADGEYSLYLNTKYPTDTPVMVSFTMDGVNQMLTIPAGSSSFNTGLKSADDPTKPYATIQNAVVSADSDTYDYKSSTSKIKDGNFALTINNNGETSTISVKYGETVQLPPVEEREGYEFTWVDSDGNTLTGDSFVMPEKAYTVTGSYHVLSFTLSHEIFEESFNGTSLDVVTYSTGETTVAYGTKILPLLNAGAREGYTLGKWQYGNGTEIGADDTMPANDVSANVKYSLNQHSMTFVVDGETVKTLDIYYGQDIPVSDFPADPEKTGYEFQGWEIKAGTKVYTGSTMPDSALTATAKLVAIDYYIYYNIDGEQKYSEKHHYGDTISIRADEVKEGYTFAWNPTTLPATMPAENITVEGTFTAIDYAFKCVVDGVEVVDTTYHFGDTIDGVENPDKEGYTFNGWNPTIPATMPSHDVTCVAEFSINSYNITYKVDGVVKYTETHEYATAISIREDEAKEGYTFSGWNPSTLPATMPAEDIEVVGTFSINSYEIVYKVDNEVYSSQTYEYAANVVAIEEPEKEGYTFSGWDEVPATMPAHDVEVNGSFTINTYTLTYKVDDEVYSAETYEYAAAITPLEEPEKVGYTFGGWDEVPATMPAHDVEVNGYFTINQYELTYVVDNEVYSSETYDYDAVISAIEAPDKTGYTFTEWQGIVERMPASDLTVTAVYQINTWTATYIIENSVFSAVPYEYGATIVDPVAPEREGYTFAWKEHPQTMPDNDITIEGEYSEILESKTIYYGIVETEGQETFDNLDSLENYEYENGVESLATFTVPASDEYTEIEAKYMDGDIEEEEFNEWCEAHNVSVYLAMPSNVTFTAKVAGTDVTSNFRANGQPFVIDGNEYQSYVYPTGNCPVSYDIEYKYALTINKN